MSQAASTKRRYKDKDKPRLWGKILKTYAYFILVVSLTRADSVDQVVVVHPGVEDAELGVVALEHVHTHPARLSRVQRSRSVPLRAHTTATRSPVVTRGGQEIFPDISANPRGVQYSKEYNKSGGKGSGRRKIGMLQKNRHASRGRDWRTGIAPVRVFASVGWNSGLV